MQENHVACADAEHDARDSIAAQRGSHFVEAGSHRPAGWHPNRPSIFHGPDVGSNQPSIIASHLLEPLAHRFISLRGSEEGRRNPLREILQECTKISAAGQKLTWLR